MQSVVSRKNTRILPRIITLVRERKEKEKKNEFKKKLNISRDPFL